MLPAKNSLNPSQGTIRHTLLYPGSRKRGESGKISTPNPEKNACIELVNQRLTTNYSKTCLSHTVHFAYNMHKI